MSPAARRRAPCHPKTRVPGGRGPRFISSKTYRGRCSLRRSKGKGHRDIGCVGTSNIMGGRVAGVEAGADAYKDPERTVPNPGVDSGCGWAVVERLLNSSGEGRAIWGIDKGRGTEASNRAVVRGGRDQQQS
ncbi:hypothetical protein SUGI_1518710 [Cryptomeria japonica]|uniref:Uncharacterized protein n=1 Tax=Cryptomeria japonica TaxID=3369 RepID=A0AAD3NN12_CRYJA|nr:hypothetical protein SUGI_1466890 [Cryptomeria japonica]GLJ59424.1 hypothetical protein SUGI_1507930 [Cryptomeria japonica]GLJ59539.1 hypothetical protein SUGI_1513430 [Cryptomeria japonica]GLJ59650.1 hypothetical protein SUGI_1517760 [Cryptomeria japonica]GLJ59659.1 hypothetical protein SUGI_1517940 [Cryptomeria japonica]